MKAKIKSWSIDVLCGCAAYVAARWIWSENEASPFQRLHWELLTFGSIYLLLQAILRGRRLAEKGK